MGIFIPATPNSEHAQAATWATSKEVGTAMDGRNDHRRLVLVAHAIGTKTTNETIQDEDMAMPADMQQSTVPGAPGAAAVPRPGHKEDGRTVCVHSLGVLPAYQGRGLGALLLRSYVQTMRDQAVGARVALITYPPLVPYYARLGFRSVGASAATFGGGGWVDMVLDVS